MYGMVVQRLYGRSYFGVQKIRHTFLNKERSGNKQANQFADAECTYLLTAIREDRTFVRIFPYSTYSSVRGSNYLYRSLVCMYSTRNSNFMRLRLYGTTVNRDDDVEGDYGYDNAQNSDAHC